jgi:hypothetical protein
MNIDQLVKNIEKVSREKMGLVIPLDKVETYEQTREQYLREMHDSLVSENLGRGMKIGKFINISEKDYKNASDVGGYCSLRIDSERKLGYDINVFIESPSGDIQGDTYLRYETLAHELGHVLMSEYREKGFLDAKSEKRFALVQGNIENAYRKLRELCTQEELSGSPSRLICSPEGSCEINKIEGINETLDIFTLEYRNSLLEIERYLCRFRGLNLDETSDEESLIQEIKKINKEIVRKREIVTQRKIIQKNIGKFRPLQRKYLRRRNISRRNSEGWACYFSNKVLEELVKNTAQIYFKEKPKVIEEYIVEEDPQIFAQFPLFRIHRERTEEWKKREDDYGIGFREYLLTKDIEEAKQKANIVA